MEQETRQPTPPTQQPHANTLAGQHGGFRYEQGDCIGGRYFVHRRASGGYGQVYLCYDQLQDYFFALKTLKLSQAALLDPNTLPRLRREVSMWIALGEHPHIVQCFTLETIDHLPFIVLEWVADDARLSRLYPRHHAHEPNFLDWYARMGRRGLPLRQNQATRNSAGVGTSLANWIGKRRLSPPFALQLLLDICSGLSHAQAVHPGFVHRDLKPANVLLTEQLRAKVTDLGTAVIAEDLVDPGSQVGTATYMAPEQWRGEAPDVGTDIYALGCMIYEMLTQQPPFVTTGRNLAQLRWQHEHAAPPLLQGQLAGTVNELVQICLQKEPVNRFASIAELAEIATAAYESLVGKSPHTFLPAPPLSVEERNKVAVTYYNLEQYDLALIEFERAAVLNSIYANTYTNRGCVYYMLGERQTALNDYTQAIRLGQQDINAKVRNNRGLLYLTEGQVERALRDFDEAIKIEPDYANAYVNRGLALIQLGDFDAALAAYGQALQLNPKHVLAYHNRGYVYQQVGEAQAALSDYAAALNHAPLFHPARLNRIALLMQLNQEDDAKRERQQLERFGVEGLADLFTIEAAAEVSRPDPQFVNAGGLPDSVPKLSLEQQWYRRIDGEGQRERLPLEAVVTAEQVAYAEWLHANIQTRQDEGQHITQLALTVNVLQADGKYHPYSSAQEWCVILDEETMHMCAGSGLHTVKELQGRRLVLRNEQPVDTTYPLRIWNVV